MAITVSPGSVATLDEVVEAVASWQQEGAPVQVHPGDLGWNTSLGTQHLADELRVWRRDGRLVAIGMADGLIRLALAPEVDEDEEFAARLVDDLSDPARGVLPAGGSVEARYGAALRRVLERRGWTPDESWTPLRRSLAEPVEDVGRRVEMLDAGHAPEQVVLDRVAVHRAAFVGSTFSVERWRAMAASASYRRARCLVAYDDDGHAVAATTVWSAGERRPGLIEPLGAHRDFRGRGHGRAITLAAAAALRELGASSVTVCTPSTNTVAVGAYVAAGFEQLPEVTDFRMPS
ncbi:GNAT family N-acetyltransferase [Flexivirga caeni]|uniref:GNAT family N-acetyltransferase n=1 Tax=Flexivirga caeni TaxID=2294115 RepID=A0A3M9M573_9MICO|nr:GNAT family N-acetyltransferase [Flexivirga caeni]RNI20714.1 GNAT family N-acetyltransferase [Flexivirga caeni]